MGVIGLSLKGKTTTMPTFNNSDENIPDTEADCERVASQEEIYLEEVEEEIRAILIFDNPCPSEAANEPLDRAAVELIAGDSDDPPLSEEAVVEMLKRSKC